MLTGSCLCGDITYTFSGEPIAKALCHCLTCRKFTSSAYATCFLVPDPDAQNSPAETSARKTGFTLQSKTNTPLRQTSTVHETGMGITFFGCAKCPSTLYKKAPDGFPGVLVVFAGCLDGSGEGEGEGEGELSSAKGGAEELGDPEAELWVKYRLPWVKELKGAKQCQEFE
ncbi:hypothetical protein LTR47_010408 [Exophiala xenobiotica]|nr:hypothetical protein LTR92_003681 [Exophiala xenobiotica]KAK5544329.1 hypothetical protein LTR23_004708 [Chaetothyriales sp. CCFEE 6169]KAK5214445.1 hypothetical protein LTR41_000638 [Exophiala xenobiotica]KAK5223154.1 hypothetical protein LTR47_010408 [Exophiala xenobiotica]KAK5226799.1 hypothetical protein LTR72_002788 [Exophiala xenobiotica]